MSRIGKQPIPLPDGVTVQVEPQLVRVKGPKGELSERVARDLGVEQQNGEIVVTRPSERGEHRALHGLTRSLIANMVQGVTEGFEKRLEIQGVGYRAQLKGRDLELALGYSHPVPVEAPEGIEFEVPAPTEVVIRGISKQAVGRDRRADSEEAPARSRTRARASATAESTWPGRSASAHERQDQESEPPAPPPARARQGARHGRAAAAGRVPLEPRGPAQLIDDEPRSHHRRGQLDRRGAARPQPDGAGQARPAL